MSTPVVPLMIALAALGPYCREIAPARRERPPVEALAALDQQPPAGRVAAGMERRVFAVPSGRAWSVVLDRLEELGLSVDKTDATHQVALTRWKKMNQAAPAWLTNARPYLGGTVVLDDIRARFLVFVSPFAAKAHVYVGSIFDGVPFATRTTTYYNVASLNQALMRELAAPLEREARAVAAAGEGGGPQAWGGSPEACRTPSSTANPVPPQRIALSKFDFIYPEPAVKKTTESAIRVAFTILEEGAVTNLRVVGDEVGDSLEDSALGVSSLMLFVPARQKDTCIRTRATMTVNYTIHPF